MDRILQNTPATVSETWYQGSTVVDPGAVTVTVTRDDGTTVTTGSATGSGAAKRDFALTSAHTAQLDRLTVTWVSATAGTITTVVEVVGGFLFTLPELRAQNQQLANQTTYPDAKLAQVRTTVETALENRLGYALVPRYTRTSFGGCPRWPLRLKPYLRTIRSLTASGTAWSAPDVAALAFDEHGFLYGTASGYSAWVDGEQRVGTYGPIIVGYEHGLDDDIPLTQEAAQQALTLAKLWATSGPVDDRATTFTVTDAGSYSMATPGRGGSFFGVPSVDEFVQYNRIAALA